MRAHRPEGGFTLLELLMMLVVIAILATMAIPQLLGSKVRANETAAMATVRTIVQAQLSFAARKEADLNENGAGEYGTFGEMSGNVAVRAAAGGTRYMEPETINPSFRAISPIGEMFRGGYYYRIYLPDATGQGLLELPGGGASADVNAVRAETTWCVYAWPQKYGTTGRKTYFANESGDLLFAEDPKYSGPGAPIPAGAALLPPGGAGNIVGKIAANQTGRDGNLWRGVGH